MINQGKVFENNFKKSVPNDVFCYRLRDSSQNWSRGELTRFAPTNVCDFIIFDGEYLILTELKNTKQKSLPYTNIKEHQLKELSMYSVFNNVKSCIIINFQLKEECYCLFINQILNEIRKNDRKSLSLDFCQKNGIKIDLKKMKTNYKYNISKWLKDIKLQK